MRKLESSGRERPRSGAFSCLALLLATPFATPVHAADPAPLLRDCEVPRVEETVRCGDLMVLENPKEPLGRRIRLHFVVLPALEPDPGRVPLFDLAGGPGVGGAGAADFFATAGRIHRTHRDLVLLDQRGTGESSPLRCPDLELRDPRLSLYPPGMAERCRQTLAKHADLQQYRTENAARDLDTVRAALGYPQIDLSALSYGTRLAVAYVRLYPENARAAALMGTVSDDAKLPLWHGHNAQMALDAIFADCENDASCRQAFPRLREKWQAVLKRVDAAPVVAASVAGQKLRFRLDRGTFSEEFRNILATTEGQRLVPFLIERMSRGDFQPFLRRVLPIESPGAEGLYLSVTCAEDTNWISEEERARASAGTFLGPYRTDEQMRACKEWNVPSVKIPGVGAPTGSADRPLLLLAGERDHVTPVAWAREISERFPQSRVVVIPKLGHFPDGLAHMECIDSMIEAFFAHGSADGLDTSCVATMKPPPFALAEPQARP